jgi:cysteine desulfurase
VDPDQVAASIGPETAVVSVMLVNNETGSINDLARIGAAVREREPGVLVHTDAVQAFGCLDLSVDVAGVDLMTITGHKFGGPKGAGLLWVREGTRLEPLLHGGGQELGRRSGTHDVAGAVGLATAMELAVADRARFRTEVSAIRDRFERKLIDALPGAVVNTPDEGRSPHHLNIRFPGVRNETLLMRLDQAGVSASAGSACQSGAATVSHVLEAMGLSPEQARESVRFSFGWTSTLDEADEAARIVIELVESLR